MKFLHRLRDFTLNRVKISKCLKGGRMLNESGNASHILSWMTSPSTQGLYEQMGWRLYSIEVFKIHYSTSFVSLFERCDDFLSHCSGRLLLKIIGVLKHRYSIHIWDVYWNRLGLLYNFIIIFSSSNSSSCTFRHSTKEDVCNNDWTKWTTKL